MGRRASQHPAPAFPAQRPRHHHLPVELLPNVFRRLPRQSQVACTMVCRIWYEPAREVLYQQASGSFRTLEQFVKFAAFAFDVRELDLSGVSAGESHAFAAAAGGGCVVRPQVAQLRSLRRALSSVLSRSPKIERLRLPDLGRAVDDSVAAAICVDRLQELNIAGSCVSDRGILRMCAPKNGSAPPGTPPVLRVLCIDRCLELTKTSLEAMTWWPALTEVSVHGHNPRFTRKSIRSMQKACLARFVNAPGEVLEQMTTEYTGIGPEDDENGDLVAG
ncbi:MAG: hypothetical protein BJ554DRAFT_1747, partial [Olpidium bornovanus]